MSHRLNRSVSSICAATCMAFAAIRKDGSVVTWGSAMHGGNSLAVQAELHDVTNIFATDAAFAALRQDGSVVTWGSANFGGCTGGHSSSSSHDDACTTKGRKNRTKKQSCSGLIDELTHVTTIAASCDTFAALRKDGCVVFWGGGGDTNLTATKSTSLNNVVMRSLGRHLPRWICGDMDGK